MPCLSHIPSLPPPLYLSTMVQSTHNELQQCLKSSKWELPGARNQLPFRHQTKRNILPKTPHEKAVLAVKRLQHHCLYTEALAHAQEVLNDQAILLHNEFGGHSAAYYLQEICQLSHIQKSSWRVKSTWNAFLWSELKKMNDGAYLYYFVFYLLIDFDYSLSWRWELP